jgi:hypothetical protein
MEAVRLRTTLYPYRRRHKRLLLHRVVRISASYRFLYSAALGTLCAVASGKNGATMKRKIAILFVATLASVFGAVGCSAEVQVDEPEELPVQVQEGEQEEGGGEQE